MELARGLSNRCIITLVKLLLDRSHVTSVAALAEDAFGLVGAVGVQEINARFHDERQLGAIALDHGRQDLAKLVLEPLGVVAHLDHSGRLYGEERGDCSYLKQNERVGSA